MTETATHIGRKISRIRELRGMKQEVLAAELGISQQAISKMEQGNVVDEDILEQVAKILGVTSDAIKNYSDEAVINYFSTFHDNSGAGAYSNYSNFNFNPIDKLIEAYEENRKLYERLLQSEQDKVEMLKEISKKIL
ncbi:helix-turn-helix domain-containing protein [Daejeonella oryzae]|uniref:helix-turn-helix domain-containing protein n=1 Tax=Daejeonella oryzae TaxID=1122943 RepID=UPI00041304CB|nr:helix-turn-helix transcriptional regulator [Daejeonella oryzae]